MKKLRFLLWPSIGILFGYTMCFIIFKDIPANDCLVLTILCGICGAILWFIRNVGKNNLESSASEEEMKAKAREFFDKNREIHL